MGTIKGLLGRFEVLDTDQIILQTMEESKDLLADLNAEQINKGLRSDGSEMPLYSLRSVIQYNKPFGPIRLRDKGNWQAGLTVLVQGDTLTFFSTDAKDLMLNKRYGSEIEGLSPKYQNEAIREKIQPVFMSKIEFSTGLKMN